MTDSIKRTILISEGTMKEKVAIVCVFLFIFIFSVNELNAQFISKSGIRKAGKILFKTITRRVLPVLNVVQTVHDIYKLGEYLFEPKRSSYPSRSYSPSRRSSSSSRVSSYVKSSNSSSVRESRDYSKPIVNAEDNQSNNLQEMIKWQKQLNKDPSNEEYAQKKKRAYYDY